MLQAVRNLFSKDTVHLARWLLHLASTGQIHGMAVVFRLVNGPDEVLFTGTYRSQPRNAVAAAACMYWEASSRRDQGVRQPG